MPDRSFAYKSLKIFAFILLAGQSHAEVKVMDSLGHEVVVQGLPKRVVSLVPHGTELFCMAGGCDRLVAVSANSDAPESVKKLPHIGPYNAISLEGILSFNPDLVLAWPSANPTDVLAQLKRLGVPVYETDPETIEQIAGELRAMAKLSGSQQGDLEAAKFLDGWAKLENMYARRRPVPVFLHIWDNPLMTLNDQSAVSSVLKVCGGYNIFGDVSVRVPQISVEEVVARQPVLIVEGDHRQRKESGELVKYWQPFNTIPAVKNRDIYSINGDYLLRATPNLLKGANELCGLIDQARKRMK
ncbi:cobalamin-binding protein [Sansalvadorimonas sp. 2012CJ34-2]|uniref:Cobalamin-binding protein n=1 Tax=Parendozoicomonas callyspongiae TaxID=2942213 RepID=A0ABT0PEN9_9GAMM|nr:cobalamin-binding protein [Sansalvadorimonas sp. 2012CJ34-2]MCL6269852.1 cobalamin-binding protein [Sansalvadorimonas sp. 2012CJ34-2]